MSNQQKNNDLQVAYYFRAFVLMECEVRSYANDFAFLLKKGGLMTKGELDVVENIFAT